MSLLGAAYVVITANTAVTLYGTSASAPVFGGMVSLVNAARKASGKSSLGWINPALYAFAPKFVKDITSGNNKCKSGSVCCEQGFYAAKGWDPVTGLGSVLAAVGSIHSVVC